MKTGVHVEKVDFEIIQLLNETFCNYKETDSRAYPELILVGVKLKKKFSQFLDGGGKLPLFAEKCLFLQ